MRKYSKTAKVLVVDSDYSLTDFVRSVLDENGYTTLTAENGEIARRILASQNFDCLLTDVNVLNRDGKKVFAELKASSNAPIIAFINADNESAKKEAIKLGAADFIAKPFGINELLLCISAVIEDEERSCRTEYLHGEIKADELVIDRQGRCATLAGEALSLTSDEYGLLSIIAEHSGKLVSDNYLTETVFGECSENNNQLLKAAIASLRKKLGENPENPKYIFTEVGAGYRLLAERI